MQLECHADNTDPFQDYNPYNKAVDQDNDPIDEVHLVQQVLIVIHLAVAVPLVFPFHIIRYVQPDNMVLTYNVCDDMLVHPAAYTTLVVRTDDTEAGNTFPADAVRMENNSWLADTLDNAFDAFVFVRNYLPVEY